MSACIASTIGSRNPERQQAGREVAGSRRAFSSVPPIALVQDRIVRDFERGVSLASLGIIYELRSKAIQQILRTRLRELEAAMRAAARPAAMGASLLMGVAVWDAVQAEQDGSVAVERYFRGRRSSRRRGLADGLDLVELRIDTPAAA